MRHTMPNKIYFMAYNIVLLVSRLSALSLKEHVMVIGSWTHDQFMEEARKFHGYPAPGLIIGGYMVEMARRALPEGILFDAISETNQCLPDAVQMLTPCTIGNGWLRIHNFGLYALSFFNKHTGEGVRVHLDVEKMGNYPEIRAWFLKEKTKAEQDTERLQEEIRQAGQNILTLRPVQLLPAAFEHKGKGKIARCPICGEWHPASYGGICRSCQGESPYETGPGLAFSGPELKAVPVEEAVGQHALHDMTQIIPGESKETAFHAGQTLDIGDVCRLQHMGRSRVYTAENAPNDAEWVHEDIAVQEFASRMPGKNVILEGAPHEGKINFKAGKSGLLWVDTERLERFNLIPDVMCTTRHSMSVLKEGTRLAGSRAIPLYIAQQHLTKALATLDEGPLFEILPMRQAHIGILITGTEVFSGLIQDKFAPILTQKAEALQCKVVKTTIVPDDAAQIQSAVHDLIAAGADLIITTAGMSVDPDDVTKKGLLDAGLTDELFGVPMLPGTMTLTGRIGNVQVLGVPACALYYKTTSIDIILPRLLAGQKLTRLDFAQLGHGGLCMECKTCIYPKCPFGR